MRLKLYGRRDCHLCAVMISRLEDLQGPLAFAFDRHDVTGDVLLEERYGLRVPVLVGPDGNEICHYHLDETRLRETLARSGKCGDSVS